MPKVSLAVDALVEDEVSQGQISDFVSDGGGVYAVPVGVGCFVTVRKSVQALFLACNLFRAIVKYCRPRCNLASHNGKGLRTGLVADWLTPGR